MQLHEIKSPRGSRKRRKIVGRGRGTGHGKTACRGENGQRSRSGRWVVGGREGGQMPLIRRLPKMGFRSHRPILNQVVNVAALSKFSKGETVNAETLKAKGLIASLNKPIKILGDGDIKQPLTVQIVSISKTARSKIEAAGGKVDIIEKKAAMDDNGETEKASTVKPKEKTKEKE